MSVQSSSGEKLQKLLSKWGIASRRQAEFLIADGQVTVNGEPAHVGQRADPAVDDIRVNGQALKPDNQPEKHYILLHKPRGVISTCDDPQGRQTVIDLLPEQLKQQARFHPVGRLDTDSTGALLLTNHGRLTQQLTHPKHHIAKTYRVRVQGVPTAAALQRWRQGIDLDGRATAPAEVTLLHPKDPALLKIVLREGRNRQIRRVAEKLGYPVLRLHRSAIGPIAVGDLPPGRCRPLTGQELGQLLALI